MFKRKRKRRIIKYTVRSLVMVRDQLPRRKWLIFSIYRSLFHSISFIPLFIFSLLILVFQARGRTTVDLRIYYFSNLIINKAGDIDRQIISSVVPTSFKNEATNYRVYGISVTRYGPQSNDPTEHDLLARFLPYNWLIRSSIDYPS